MLVLVCGKIFSAHMTNDSKPEKKLLHLINLVFSCFLLLTDGRTKIESMLLEHWHEFFSSHLSRNALHRQIKQKALEIASKSDLKFKGSKKWLISFVKRCELLGYINVDVVNESNGLQANFRNTSFCSNAASSNNSVCFVHINQFVS